MKTAKELAQQKQFDLNDVLTIFVLAEHSVGLDSYSNILDLKEELGFERYQDPD